MTWLKYDDKTLSLEVTLDSGQAFRWTKISSLHAKPFVPELAVAESFTRVADKAFEFREHIPEKNARASDFFIGVVDQTVLLIGDFRSQIWAKGWNESGPLSDDAVRAIVAHYLCLNVDYKSIQDKLTSIDEVISVAVSFAPGLRLLRQNPWETLISFIISANNNIPRIKSTIMKLSQRFGAVIETDYGPFHGFPSPQILASASEDDLRQVGLGFRAPFIKSTAEIISQGELDLAQVANMDTDEARWELMKLPGVGPKVADCVLLFSMGKLDVFPVDVWIKRALEVLYFGGAPQTRAYLRKFALEKFGDLAGYAENYLFYYARMRSL